MEVRTGPGIERARAKARPKDRPKARPKVNRRVRIKARRKVHPKAQSRPAKAGQPAPSVPRVPPKPPPSRRSSPAGLRPPPEAAVQQTLKFSLHHVKQGPGRRRRLLRRGQHLSRLPLRAPRTRRPHRRMGHRKLGGYAPQPTRRQTCLMNQCRLGTNPKE